MCLKSSYIYGRTKISTLIFLIVSILCIFFGTRKSTNNTRMVLKLLAVLNGKIGYLFSRKKNNDITPDLLQCFFAFQVAKKNVPCLLHLDLLVADPPNLSVSLSELRPKIVGTSY